MNSIQSWMDHYDSELDRREQENYRLKVHLEKLADDKQNLQLEMDEKQVEIEKYLKHKKLQRKQRARELRAALKIQVRIKNTKPKLCNRII